MKINKPLFFTASYAYLIAVLLLGDYFQSDEIGKLLNR